MNKRMAFLIILIVFFVIGCSTEDATDVFQEKDEEKAEDTVDKTVNEQEIPIDDVLPSEELQKGDEHENVLNLQQALIEIGYPIETSGKFDELTTWAITDFQLQHDQLIASGTYNNDVKEMIEEVRNEDRHITAGSMLEEPTHPDEFTEIVENPYDILVLVNKSYALPSEFEPADLVIPDVRF